MSLDRLNEDALNGLMIFFPIMGSWSGRFLGEINIVVDDDLVDYGYADPAWVFSINGYKNYVEYYDV